MRLGIAFCALISLALFGMLSSLSIVDTGKGYAAAINQTASLRMQSYRIASSLIHTSDGNSLNTFEITDSLVDEFERRLLSERISSVLMDDAPPDLLEAYRLVERQWRYSVLPHLANYLRSKGEGVNSTLTESLSERIAEARSNYLMEVDDFSHTIDNLVSALELESESQTRLLSTILIVGLMLILMLVTITLFMVNIDVLQPMRELLRAAKSVSRGDFSVRPISEKNDELGQLTLAFNHMAEELSLIYTDLEQRVRDKTQALERSNRELELLYLASKHLSTSPPTQGTFEDLLSDLKRLVGIEGGKICLGEPCTDTPSPVAHVTLTCAEVAKELNSHGCLRCVDNTAAVSLSTDFQPSGDGRHVVIPIREQEQQYGVLLIKLHKNQVLKGWHWRLLDVFAKHIATALLLAQRNAQDRVVSLLEERSVIARELHDSLAQSLSYLKIQMSRLERSFKGNNVPRQTHEISTDIRSALNIAYRDLRELLRTFRMQISQKGLNHTIEEAVQEYRHRGRIVIELENQIPQLQISPDAEIHLLQIIRESLSNVIRHSEAKQASVTLNCSEQGLVSLLVDDDGSGLTGNNDHGHHFGLAIMRERANGLRGELEIGDSPLGGTRVGLQFSMNTDPGGSHYGNE